VFDQDRKDRHVKNEAVFRSLNERVRDVAESIDLAGVADSRDVEQCLCECADPACTATINLTPDEYEAVRASPIQFAVLPAHVVPDVETVVGGNERFAIVRKDVGERAHAIATDPRSSENGA